MHNVQALCTEAALAALRRSYPQIYGSDQRLLVDARNVSVQRADFLAALAGITPAAHRSAATHARCAGLRGHDRARCQQQAAGRHPSAVLGEDWVRAPGGQGLCRLLPNP